LASFDNPNNTEFNWVVPQQHQVQVQIQVQAQCKNTATKFNQKKKKTFTQTDLGKEYSILQYITIMLDVYQVCYSVGCRIVLIKHRSESQWTVAGISYYLKNVECYCRIVYSNFVF